MKLIDVPVGLFIHNDILALKTEYGDIINGEYTPDCFIIESGEYFNGNTKNTSERNNLEVKPIKFKNIKFKK